VGKRQFLSHMSSPRIGNHGNLESEGFDALSGFVYQHLGKIPVVGDEVQADGLEMRVLSVIGRRIKKVRVKKELPPPSNGNGSNDK